MKTLLFAPRTLAALAAATLAACGGGGSTSTPAPAATTPTPAPVASAPAPAAADGQSIVAGTITGFGSVIVDGIRIDNSAVSAGKELEDGSVKQVELKLGQHVEVQHDGQLVASRVRVSANVEGTVSAVNAGAGTLTVAGQVLIVNTDASLGPVTIFEGYASLAGVQPNDRVEAHGLIKTDAAGKTTVQATRVEKAGATGDTADRVSGLVADLSAASHTFKLGALLVDYSAARVLPEGASLANGVEVNVALPLGTVAGGTAVKATLVKVRDHKNEVGAKDSELGGAISAIDTAQKLLTIAGIKVDASAARFDQAGRSFADLKVNSYVVVKGSYASEGVLKASTIVLRGVDDSKDKAVELHGTIVRFASVASFAVRDVKVDATGVTPDPGTCGGVRLANDLQVDIRGTLTAAGVVKATSISCEKATETHVVLSREGAASNVDATAKTFTLTTSKESITVKWTATTLFKKVDAATLSGKKVEIEGTTANGVFTATKIGLED